LGHGLLRANDCHRRDRRLVTSRPPPGELRSLTKKADKNWTASFTFRQPAGDRLILDGRMDNHQVHMELQLTDRNSFLLVSRGFHWIQEAPFGRYYRDQEK
jgi:hypothetical protein